MVAHVDQKAGKITGVICDLCNKSLIDKFSYFSAKFDFVEVDRAIGKSGIVKHDKRALDLDVCPECLEKLKSQVIHNINQRQNQGVWTTTGAVQHTQSLDADKHQTKPEPKKPFLAPGKMLREGEDPGKKP